MVPKPPQKCPNQWAYRFILHSNHSIPSLAPKGSRSSQNAKCFQTPSELKTPLHFKNIRVKIAKANWPFNYDPVEKSKTNLYTISTQWHRVNFPILKVWGWGKTGKPQQGKHQMWHLHTSVTFTVASSGFQWAWVAPPRQSCSLGTQVSFWASSAQCQQLLMFFASPTSASVGGLLCGTPSSLSSFFFFFFLSRWCKLPRFHNPCVMHAAIPGRHRWCQALLLP